MTNQPGGQQEHLRVTFSPPLYLQRRIWVFDIMRRENVTDVLDIGCADGELLCALCNPAPWLSPHHNTTEKFKSLHPRHIRGLDISVPDLEYAVKFTSPPTPSHSDQSRYMRPRIRWEPLQVDIWKGSLDTVNEQFIGVDCIVSSEVIEHLPEDILAKFAPTLLGVYHPRLLLVTTPSYTFNARFSPPPEHVKTGNIRLGGHPDPTHRTTRIFRHPDHKFEWTAEEFARWCNGAAIDWGYRIEIEGVGKPMEEDEWGRDDEVGYASQVALFTRIEGEEATRIREEKIIERERECDHELLVTHRHNSHPHAENPLPPKDILERVRAEMGRCQDFRLTVRELWDEDEVAVACGGQVDSLIDAVVQGGGGEFVLHIAQEIWREEWHIELVGGVQQKQNLWKDEAHDDDELNLELSQSEENNTGKQMPDITAEDKTLEYTYEWGSDETLGTGTWGASSGWTSESGWGGFKQTEEIDS